RQRTTRPRRIAGTTPRPQTPEGQRIGVAHLTAEYWPFARTGGLGEAVSGLATFEAAAGHPATGLMPLYNLVRETTPTLERTGHTFTVNLGGKTSRTAPTNTRAPSTGPRFVSREHLELFDGSGINGKSPAGPSRRALPPGRVRVVRPHEHAQRRAGALRRGGDGQPHPRPRAVHPGRGIRAARHVHRYGRPLARHSQRDRSAPVESRNRPRAHGSF